MPASRSMSCSMSIEGIYGAIYIRTSLRHIISWLKGTLTDYTVYDQRLHKVQRLLSLARLYPMGIVEKEAHTWHMQDPGLSLRLSSVLSLRGPLLDVLYLLL
jgi:hypothetical protein